MKQLLSFVATLVFSVATFAQSEEITWRHHVEHQEGNEYRVIFTGTIAPGYHTYTLTDEFSPTEFLDMTVTGGELVGLPYEVDTPVKEIDEFGDLTLRYYNRIVIAQDVLTYNSQTAKLSGTIFTFICDDGSVKPCYYDFNLDVTPQASSTPKSRVQRLLENPHAYLKNAVLNSKKNGAQTAWLTNIFEAPRNIYDIEVITNFEEGLVKAEKENRPIIVEVGGYGCVHCREMEAKVWSNLDVKKLMSQYVVICLYVDDKSKLPESEWIKNIETGKYYKIVGHANDYLARTLYNTMTQPTYVLLKPNGEILVPERRNYGLDIADFCRFLNEGLKEFKILK